MPITAKAAGAVAAALLLAAAAAPAPAPAQAPAAQAPAAQSPAGRESFAYAPPERAPRGQRTRYVDEPPDAVFQAIWAELETQGLRIESVNPTERLVAARYSGDPRPYLDCGTVTVLVDGVPADPPRTYDADKDEVRTGKSPKGRRYGLLRQLHLDARLVVRVEQRGKGARIYSDAVYVATKSIRRLRKGGRPDALVDRETVSFTSAESGRFEKGTLCVGTGRLENLPIEPFKREDETAG
jgi:hypothetical protein